MKNAANSAYVSYNPELSDGCGDDHEQHIVVDFIDLHRNVGFAPHIRDPRTDCNATPERLPPYRPAKFGTRRSDIALTPSLKSSVTRRRFCSSSS